MGRAAREMRTDVLVVGGGLGGVSATLAAASLGARVVLVEELDWLGGQLTAQAVPPDEHPWIETLVASRSYAALREGIRAYYRRHYPLTAEARRRVPFNPGMGNVAPFVTSRRWRYESSKKCSRRTRAAVACAACCVTAWCGLTPTVIASPA